MKATEKAKEILDKHRNYQSADPHVQDLLDSCFRFAYSKGSEETIKEVETWFREKGPFVFPEDEETLQDLLKYLRE